MAKNKDAPPADAPDTNARLTTSKEDQDKAAKWFARARELGEKRQFDYALEYYVNGLEFWPDAVEEACKALHGCAVARRQTGGKKPGLKDTMKRSMTDKNPKKAFINAMWLFGHDPDNMGYIEGVARAAGRLRAEDACKWAGGVLLKALESLPKVSAKQCQGFIEIAEDLGDRAGARGEVPFGVTSYQMGVDAINLWRRRMPGDAAVDGLLKNLSTKLTILKGKYQDGESYRDSIADKEGQEDLHDEQRSVQSDVRVDELLAKAEEAYRQNPADQAAIKQLVEMLCRREREDEEVRAIGVLVNEFKRGADYRWKIMADDIRIKQLGRKARELEQNGNAEAVKEQRIAQLRFELTAFKERSDRYPTDNRIRFEYAVRKFRAGRFDEAIPLFQTARLDAKNRAACGMYLGRCFLRKGYHSEAVNALQEALQGYEFADDDLAKTMLYWLARAQEEGGQAAGARESYGKLLQMDYTYKDVRARMDALPARG